MSQSDREAELIDQLKTAARLFDGAIHGVGTDRVVGVEFPTMLKAASFVEATHLEQDAMIDIVKDRFDVPVVVMFSLIAYAMCR